MSLEDERRRRNHCFSQTDWLSVFFPKLDAEITKALVYIKLRKYAEF